MTTYTLTGQITDFGDVAATNVTGTVEAGGLVDGSWVPLSRYVGPDYLTHVGATEVKVAADRSLVRSDTGGPIVLEASNDLFSYRLTLRIARGRAHVYYFTLSRDLDVRELDLAVPDPALDAVAPPHDLYIPASGTTPQPVAGAVTWDTSMRDVQAEISLTADTTITLTGDRLGAMVYIIPTLNTHILTVGDFIVSDRAAFHRELGGWVMLAGGSVITPDVTPPTAGTLASSAITQTGFTLTVTGASDAGDGLHATAPYAFSTDNGATWSAWQASNVYAVTGKTAATAYQARHKVRDAAATPNEATGTAITVTTASGATWHDVIKDAITGANAAVMHARHPDTTGTSLSWTKGAGWQGSTDNTKPDLVLDGTGRAKAANADSPTVEHWVTLAGINGASMEMSIQVSMASQANSNAASVVVRLEDLVCTITQAGVISMSTGSGKAVPTMTGSMTGGASGTLTLRKDGTAVTVLWNGASVGTGTLSWTQTPTFASFACNNFGNSWVEDVAVGIYS